MKQSAARVTVALALGFACAGGRASGASSDPTLTATSQAAAALATIVRSINTATGDTALVRALARNGVAGDPEPCLAPDGRLSQRPGALRNPPYSAAAIAQRDRTMRALGAYAFVLGSAARGEVGAQESFAQATFERAALALLAAANVHGPGDFFVEDRAATLASLALRLHDVSDTAARKSALAEVQPVVIELLARARSDATARRLDALAATQQVSRTLAAYAAHTSAGGDVPCGQPIVPSSAVGSAGSIAAAEVASVPAGALDSLPPGLRAFADTAALHARALATLDIDSVFATLGDQLRGELAIALLPDTTAARPAAKLERAATAFGQAAGSAAESARQLGDSVP